MSLGAFEDHDLVTTRPPLQTFGSFAGTFRQDLDLLPDQIGIASGSDLIDQRQQALISLFLHGGWQLLGHRRRRSIAPRRVSENKSLIEFNFPSQRQGFLEILFRLARKTDNEISADAHLRLDGAQ